MTQKLKDEVRQQKLIMKRARLFKKLQKLFQPFVEKIMRPLLEREKNPLSLAPEEMEKEIKKRVASETQALVAIWFSVFFFRSDESLAVNLKTVDDAMLPPLNKDVRNRFEQAFTSGFLDAEKVREILRQVRASLPAGKILPDEMVELLELTEGVKVAP